MTRPFQLTRLRRALVASLPLVVLALAPDAGAQQRSRPPAPAPVKPAAFPPFKDSVLANGLRVVLV